jgi:hypothetical protein
MILSAGVYGSWLCARRESPALNVSLTLSRWQDQRLASPHVLGYGTAVEGATRHNLRA